MSATKREIQIIGGMIRINRRSRGLTQVELAKKLGVSSKILSDWERGTKRVPGVYLYKIASILGFSIP